MKKRRTKKEMMQARYNAEVDAYKFFIMVNDCAVEGYESKEDAIEASNDYEFVTVKSIRQLKALGISAESIKTSFKNA